MCVHGQFSNIQSHLSPAKDSSNMKTKFFDGRLTDGRKSVRLVSFLRGTFNAVKQDKKPIDST